MKHKLEYYLMIGFAKLLMMFSEKTRYKIGEKIGIIGYHLIKKRRMIALANLKLAFPKKTDEERIELAKKNYKVLAKAYLSSLWIKDFIFDETKVSVENYHILDDAIAENNRQFESFLKEEIDVYEIEYRLNVYGKQFWYYNRGTIIKRDKKGRATLVGGIAMNISHRYNHLLSKIEEGSKFEFIFKNTSEPVFISTIRINF